MVTQRLLCKKEEQKERRGGQDATPERKMEKDRASAGAIA